MQYQQNKKRGAYNKKYVANNKIIKWPTSYFSDYKKIKIKKNSLDLIIVPNLLHHINDHKTLISKCFEFLKKGGNLYLFEPILRELHQAPEDYLRFTPFWIEKFSTRAGI